MDLNDTKDEADFRAQVRGWLDKNAVKKKKEDRLANVNVGGGGEDFLKRAKTWQAKKAEAGYAAITWPKEFGGFGWHADAIGDLWSGRKSLSSAERCF